MSGTVFLRHTDKLNEFKIALNNFKALQDLLKENETTMVGSKKSAPLNPPDIETTHTDLLKHVALPTIEEISMAIGKIKSGKAAGSDNIPAEAWNTMFSLDATKRSKLRR
ncbi:unnamed protein product [Schistosoma curassoni]|uniref:Reverse transcriptase domain-containing protein n=1 Tax=Schistosoma curassoni TaxID=6186 RepID=A0A183KGV1_9TREM|nr:unnamed protein product [Schistosoma curassoni]